MDRKGTNELISGEKSFIAILSNLRVYFVVRLPDYVGVLYEHGLQCIEIMTHQNIVFEIIDVEVF